MSASSAPSSRALEAAHLLNRISFGPKPGDVAEFLNKGERRYIREQLEGALPDTLCQARLDPWYLIHQSVADAVHFCLSGRNYEEQYEEVLTHLRAARLFRAVFSRNQLREVMVDFWYNHFNVYAYPWVQSLPAYEREAIRPHALGRFRDLLGAVAAHPAMLYYLDNYLNRCDHVVDGKPVRGVNENYGRELLELHTVGVDAGYTQRDVYNAARVFTGWMIEGWQTRDPAYVFWFEPRRHDDERKTVFGIDLACGKKDEGDKLLDALARHPKTAHFVSRKLVQRFVADDPPASLVDRCARVFLHRDGDIRAVLETILVSDELHAPEVMRGKVKTPLEFVVSTVRAADGEVSDPAPIADAMADMGMPLYECKPPTGYSNRSTDFLNPSGQMFRFDFALRFAGGQMQHVRPTTAFDSNADAFISNVETLIGQKLSDVTASALRGVAATEGGSNRLALLFASPEFQHK